MIKCNNKFITFVYSLTLRIIIFFVTKLLIELWYLTLLGIARVYIVTHFTGHVSNY